MSKILKYIIAFLGCVSLTGTINAQNLEMIGKSDPVKVSGGVSSNQVFYASNDSTSKRMPFSTVFTGNINFNVYEMSIPFSFTWSNQSYGYQQPFNRYSLHPKYKWATAHLGYTSMSFSSYTLNGQIFSGAGVELAPPGLFSVSAMYGRFQQAVYYDSINPANTTYGRFGYGLKGGMKIPENKYVTGDVGLIFFHAKDELNSVTQDPMYKPVFDSLGISPKQNVVLGTSANLNIYNKVNFSFEIAQSALTRDIRDSAASGDKSNFLSSLGGIYNTNATTEQYKAFKTNISYAFLNYNVGVGYERIDPGYSTLGAYYFTNDLENITLNLGGRFIKGKLSITESIGRQSDNLDNRKTSSLSRWVTSTGVSYAHSDKLNLSGSYSTFQSYTNFQSKLLNSTTNNTPFTNADTLDYMQLSQSANITASYTIQANEVRRKNLMVSFNWQTSAQKQGIQSTKDGATFYNVNTTYAYAIVPLQLNISCSLNGILNKIDTIRNVVLGPVVSVSKTFFEKTLRSNISFSLNNSYNNGELGSRIFTIRSNATYVVKKKHNLNLGLIFQNRASYSTRSRKMSDFTATFGYSYGF